MADKTVLDFPYGDTPITLDDIFYLLQGTGTDRDKKIPLGALPRQNLVLNPDGAVAQQGTSFDSTTTPANNDDTYLLDQWNLLSDGNDRMDVDQIEITDLPRSQFCQQVTINSVYKSGLLQILEHRNIAPFRGQPVSLSFKVKGSAAVDIEIRAAVLEWAGNKDYFFNASDVVSAWNAAGTNPTLITNWSYANTPSANIELTDSWQTVTIENITLGSSVNNLAVFIWMDTGSVADYMQLAQVNLNGGVYAAPYMPRLYSDELYLCQRYFWRARVDPPGVSVERVLGSGQCIANNTAHIVVPLPVPLRFGDLYASIVPTVSVSNATHFILTSSAGAHEPSNAVSRLMSGHFMEQCIGLAVQTSTTNLTAGDATIFLINDATNAFLDIDIRF